MGFFQMVGVLTTLVISFIVIRFIWYRWNILKEIDNSISEMNERVEKRHSVGSANDQKSFIIWRERFDPHRYPVLKEAFSQVEPEIMFKTILHDYPIAQHLKKFIEQLDNKYGQNSFTINNKDADKLNFGEDMKVEPENLVTHHLKLYVYTFTVIFEFFEVFRQQHLFPEFRNPFHFALMTKLWGADTESLYDFVYERLRPDGTHFNNPSPVGIKLINLALRVKSHTRSELFEYAQIAPTSLTSPSDVSKFLMSGSIELPSLEAIYEDQEWTRDI
jgi:hypothetical protein